VAISVPSAAAYLAAGLAAGVFNAIAGGGTLVCFPTLLAFGVPAVTANVTSAVGIVPSYFGSVHGFRAELSDQLPRIRRLLPTALVGSAVGAFLLLSAPAASFRQVAPWLVGAATLLFALQPRIVKRLSSLHDEHPTRQLLAQAGTFAVAVYGGYFGAGMSIMLLTVLSISLTDSLIRINGLRAVVCVFISIVSATIFIFHGHVLWPAALCLAAGTLPGGWLGAHIARFLSPAWLRLAVVVFGTATTIGLLV
jgi:uncharacterized membrane protein YfcA